MDIRLNDGLSFDIFNKVPIVAPVIFVTAYNEYALQAFKANGIDYILKPFDENELGRPWLSSNGWQGQVSGLRPSAGSGT